MHLYLTLREKRETKRGRWKRVKRKLAGYHIWTLSCWEHFLKQRTWSKLNFDRSWLGLTTWARSGFRFTLTRGLRSNWTYCNRNDGGDITRCLEDGAPFCSKYGERWLIWKSIRGIGLSSSPKYMGLLRCRWISLIMVINYSISAAE